MYSFTFKKNTWIFSLLDDMNELLFANWNSINLIFIIIVHLHQQEGEFKWIMYIFIYIYYVFIG